MSELHEIIKMLDLVFINVAIPYLTFKACDKYRIRKIYKHKKIIKVAKI